MEFPLPFIPTISYKGENGFGGSREGVRHGLMHAANDLAAPAGTPVAALDAGVVINGPYDFFRGTFALEIRHPRFIARYCEIDRVTEVQVGDAVEAGQVIGYVGDQPGNDMLHLEFFTGRLHGNLSFAPGTHLPFDRRDDVFDGAKFLDEARSSRAGWNQYIIRTEDSGKKFLQPIRGREYYRDTTP